MSEIAVIPTGVANTASVLAGLRRAGGKPRLERDPERIAAADHAVLPGVGAFAAGMRELHSADLGQVLRARIAAGRPTLAICLGLQLLCERSEESPGVDGLGCVAGDVAHFDAGVRAPQFGWNHVTPAADCRLLRPGYAYFANSYRLPTAPPGWHAATADHGGRFVAAMEHGAVLACQFHPELSGRWGIDLLRRWLETEAC